MQLLCLGDVAIVHESNCKSDWKPPLPGFPSEHNRILLNWEFPVGTQLNLAPRTSGRRFLAHPCATKVVRSWAPGFATLATNHMLDAGVNGISVTKKMLHEAGFETVGAGNNLPEINAPLVWETEQGRLTILNWVFPETNPDWKTIPGVSCWPGLKEAATIIQQVRQTTDWLIVILHWSDELFPYPLPEDRVTAGALAAFGVDAVIGHHPHVVRGMEIFHSVPVFYSLGNYFFSDLYNPETKTIEKHAPRNLEALGVLVTFKLGNKPVFEPVSFLQKNDQVILDKHRRAAKRMAAESKPLAKFAGKAYENWYGVQRNRFLQWGARWHFVIRRLGVLGLIKYGLRKL